MTIITASHLILSRKSKLRFLAGGNVTETCCEERLRRDARIPRSRSLMFPGCERERGGRDVCWCGDSNQLRGRDSDTVSGAISLLVGAVTTILPVSIYLQTSHHQQYIYIHCSPAHRKIKLKTNKWSQLTTPTQNPAMIFQNTFVPLNIYQLLCQQIPSPIDT